jgi:DnaJ-class molecular chaperone
MDELHQCPECDGRGVVATLDYVEAHLPFPTAMPCENCSGQGWLTSFGEPYYPEPELKDLNKEQA